MGKDRGGSYDKILIISNTKIYQDIHAAHL